MSAANSNWGKLGLSRDLTSLATCFAFLPFDQIAQSGTILQALAPAGWAPLCGMVKDQFGITWVLDVVASYTAP